MSEELLIKHCSPTLAGIKTGNLFSCPYTSKKEAAASINRLNEMFNPKGVKILPLKFDKGRILVYVFRPSRLKKDLSNTSSCKLLRSRGYRLLDPESCLRQLCRRVKNGDEFPHEIGLFLGYPAEDVKGFILNNGKNHKICGCRKVYGDEQRAAEEFAKFKKCSDVYYSKWLQGFSVLRLTVTV